MPRLSARWVVWAMAVPSALALCACGSSTAHHARHGSGRGTATSTTVAPTTSTTAAAAPAGWLTYGGNFARTSVDAGDPARSAAPVAAWSSPALDGPVYGEPLIFQGEVLVATENDTVYALSAANGKVLWADHLGIPVPAAALPCGDIAPAVGITSTMVIDPAAETIFASAELTLNGAVVHQVVAIDLVSHHVRWRRAVDQPGWTASTQLQRSALALSAGRVLVGFGGNYGDCGAYSGWVVGVPQSGMGALAAYRVPVRREGGVWAPAGVAVDASGNVFVATGNGAAQVGDGFDHSNSVVELSPQLSESQYFAPTTWAQSNGNDADLGSTAPVLLGNGQVFIVGKDRTGYLLNAAALGGIGGQVATVGLCESLGGSAYVAPDVYVVCPQDGKIMQVKVGPGNALSQGWTWSSPTATAGSPTLAGGVLWSLDTSASVLYGVDPATGSTRFTVPLLTGTPAHFAAPAAADGLIVVAGSKAVVALR